MALIKCPECSKDVSSSAVMCPHCGFQITPTFASEFNKALAEQQAPAKKKRHISTGKGLLMILVGSVLGIFLLVQFNSDSPQPRSKSYEAGRYVGSVDGNVAFNGGRLKPTDEQLDAAARNYSSNVRFGQSGDREQWIDGYKDGYRAGWK